MEIKSIKIGRTIYKIEMLPADITSLYGACSYEYQIIYMSPNQTYQQASDTLLHEVLHAIWNESSLEHAIEIEQEIIVRTTSTWLLMVLDDNPQLLKFLTKGKSMWTHKPNREPLKELIE